MSIKKLLQNQKGFSLIELLIVIGILAILAVIIIPRFADTGEDSRKAANSTNISLLQSAVERYAFDTGKYPVVGGDQQPDATTGKITGGEINQQTLVTGKYITEKAKNPWDDVSVHDNKGKKYILDTDGKVLLGNVTE